MPGQFGNYSAKQFAAIYSEHKADLKSAKSVDCANASEAFKQSRKNDFYSAITIDNEPVASRLQTQGNDRTALDSIKEALKPTDSMSNAIKDFKKKINTLNQVLASKQTFEALAVTDKLAEYKREFEDAIDAQQTQEREAIEKLFDKSNGVATLSKLGIHDATPEKIEEVKNQFLEALAKEHEAQRKAFLDPVNKAHNELHKAIEKDLHRINVLATARNYKDKDKSRFANWWHERALFGGKYSPFDPQAPVDMREDINTLETKNLTKKSKRGASLRSTKQEGGLRDIELENLKRLQTLSGQRVTKNGNNLIVNLASLSSWDWWDLQNETDVFKDIRSLAEMVRAEGYDGIKFTIDHPNEKIANKLAKQ